MSVTSLDQLAGLASAKRIVKHLTSGQSGIQSVLIYGPEGVGKDSLANILVEAWLRKSPDGEEDRAITAYRRGNSTDLLTISPGGLSNWISVKAVVNDDQKNDESTPIRDFLRTTPLLAKHKIVLIRECHRMTKDAANALLKTLEEPLPHAKLILTTSAIGSVIGTIRSRCLCVACELPTEAEMKAVGIEPSSLEQKLSTGAPGLVQRIRDLGTIATELETFAKDLRTDPPGMALIHADKFRGLAEDLAESRKLPARLANAHLLEMLGTLMLQEQNPNPRAIQLIAEAHRRIIGNGSTSLVFDALFTQISTKG